MTCDLEMPSWRREVHLFTLTTVSREYPVFWWPGYGVVCPTYITTNGSAGVLLAAVRPEFGLRPGLLHPQSVDELANVLLPWVSQQRLIERGG